MKKALLVIFTLFCLSLFAQNESSLEAFEALDSNIGATISIIKSDAYKITATGDSELLEHIDWEVNDRNLKIRSDTPALNYNEVFLTIYTPSLGVLKLSDGGKATMHESFERIDSFEASAADSAVVDLSRISYKTLVANSASGGLIIYNDPTSLIISADDKAKPKGIQL